MLGISEGAFGGVGEGDAPARRCTSRPLELGSLDLVGEEEKVGMIVPEGFNENVGAADGKSDSRYKSIVDGIWTGDSLGEGPGVFDGSMDGKKEGWSEGRNDGKSDGKRDGPSDGINEGVSEINAGAEDGRFTVDAFAECTHV